MDFYHSEGTSVLQYNFYDLQGSLLIFMQQAHCYDKCLEQEMATDSSSLAWRVPWIEKPEGVVLQSMESQRVRQDLVTNNMISVRNSEM